MEITPSTPAEIGSAQIESVSRSIQSRLKRFFIWLAVILMLFVLGAVLCFHAYIAWILARPQVAPLVSDPQLAIGVPFENVQFPSRDQKTVLDGWYIPGSSDKTVIFSHGYGGNREEIWVPIYDLASALHKQNYNVLMFDYGFVRPDRIVTGGVQEAKELLGAVDYMKQMGSKQVFVWGFSMGAGTALQAALDSLDIDGMILDSTFLLEPDTLYHNMKQYVDLPRFPSLALVRLFFPILNGVSLHDIPYQEVKSKEYPMPIFFIHGEEDEKAPYEIAEHLYENQKSNPLSQLWLLPHDTHELIYRAHPKQYLEKTLDFLKKIVQP